MLALATGQMLALACCEVGLGLMFGLWYVQVGGGGFRRAGEQQVASREGVWHSSLHEELGYKT